MPCAKKPVHHPCSALRYIEVSYITWQSWSHSSDKCRSAPVCPTETDTMAYARAVWKRKICNPAGNVGVHTKMTGSKALTICWRGLDGWKYFRMLNLLSAPTPLR